MDQSELVYLIDTVDAQLTVQTVKGIYMYRKDHTMESMIFTWWSKKVIPFPSLRHKIQAYQGEKINETVLPWNNGNAFQFSVPPMTSQKSQKESSWKDQSQVVIVNLGITL